MHSLKKVLQNVEMQKKALGHFNISNLEQLKAIAHVAIQYNAPVIVGVSEGEREYLGMHHVRDLVDSYNKEHSSRIPSGEAGGKENAFWIFLNADHTHSLEHVQKAADAKCDAILCDFGKLSLEENIAQTKKAVKIIRAINPHIFIEGELGYIGGSSELRKGIPQGAAIQEKDLTTPEDAIRFVQETDVDMLAPAVGNVHGMMTDAPEPRLDIQRIRAIKNAVKIPLVLHGASGNTDQDIRTAIEAGVSIVHISTELRLAWREGIEESLKENPDELAPYKLVPEALQKMEKLVAEKLKICGW